MKLMNTELLVALRACAEQNQKVVNAGNVEGSISTVGCMEGMTRTLRCLGFGAAVGISVKNNGCHEVSMIRVTGFTIWERGELKKEQYEKALNYYGKSEA